MADKPKPQLDCKVCGDPVRVGSIVRGGGITRVRNSLYRCVNGHEARYDYVQTKDGFITESGD